MCYAEQKLFAKNVKEAVLFPHLEKIQECRPNLIGNLSTLQVNCL